MGGSKPSHSATKEQRLASGAKLHIVASMTGKPSTDLRRGWTTGACASAATKAALQAFWGGGFPRDVTITLPKGERPCFALAHQEQNLSPHQSWAEVGITKDAGDDPDVTHGALIIARVAKSSGGIVFKAGKGVGTVTKAGLPIGIGEPAINPVPRQMMTRIVTDSARQFGQPPNIEITLSIPHGAEIAQKTWNPRLGIVGGLSILGTTGVVRPFSCSAWIASIHRGVDVARAEGLDHLAGCTGATSEKVVQRLHSLPDGAMLDMGDFSGGLLKYLVKHPVSQVTIGGGIGKITKLAQGAVDLHSSRSTVDFGALNHLSRGLGLEDVSDANTALEAVNRAGGKLAEVIAALAQKRVSAQLGTGVKVDIIVIERAGAILGHAK